MNILLFILFVLTIGNGTDYLCADLFDVYKTGAVQLVPDLGFGKDSDWQELFYHKAHYPAVGPDSCVFLANARDNNITKFSPDGEPLKTFGQKGLGPGDLILPSDLTILDKRYLIVKEHLAYRRVSIFDLDGHFVKLIKTDYSVHACCAMKNNKLALLTLSQLPGKSRREYAAKLYILDIKTGNDSLIYSRNLDVVKETTVRGTKVFYSEEVFMHATKEGNVLLGFNNNPDILIFSPVGIKEHSFKLKLAQQRITSELKHRMYNIKLKRATENPAMERKYREGYKKSLVRNKSRILSEYSEFFPYYDDLFIDSDNNILVLKNRYIDEPDWNWTPVYQVYSVQGELKCEFTLHVGGFDYKARFQKLFFNGYLYGIFEKETDDDDVIYTLEKMALKPKSTKTRK